MKTETSLTVVSATTGHDDIKYEIISEGQRAVTLTFEDIDLMYYQRVKDILSPILNTVISNLIRSRDFLGLQLNFEFGNITTEQYEQLELDFITEPQEISPSELKKDVDILMRLSNKVFNAEEISTMFNCSFNAAEKAINLILLGETKK
jgi:hypothetical protein